MIHSISNDGKTISRFTKVIRIAHWTNALSVIMLYITALPLYTDSFDWVGSLFGGANNAIFVHKIFAVIFILPTLFVLMVDPKSFLHWTKQIFSWKSHDFKFLKEFPKEFFGKKADMPKQDFFNAGQKINSLLTILVAVLMVVTGAVIWLFAPYLPKAFVLWMFPLHSLGAGLMIAVAIGHIYLSVGHPSSRPSIKGMTEGAVDVEYAKEHHGRWYDEVAAGSASQQKSK